MKKLQIIAIGVCLVTVSFMAGAMVSTQITSKQNRDIWNGVLQLIGTVDLVKKTT